MSELRNVPWYDRNPLAIRLEYEPHQFAGHTETKRADYLVPGGRMAFIGSVDIGMERVIAADAVQVYWISVFAIASIKEPETSSGCLMMAFSKDNTVGKSLHKSLANAGVLLPGEQISLWTSDDSTGGMVLYSGHWSLIEFDAYPIEELPFQPQLPERDIQEPKKPWWWPF